MISRQWKRVEIDLADKRRGLKKLMSKDCGNIVCEGKSRNLVQLKIYSIGTGKLQYYALENDMIDTIMYMYVRCTYVHTACTPIILVKQGICNVY